MPDFTTLTRYSTFAGVICLTVLSLIALIGWSGWFVIPFLVFGALSLLGLRDVRQESHSVLRNYPVLGHVRFLMEKIRPEIRQYLLEDDQDEEPFSRDQRSLVYQRTKGQETPAPSAPKNVYTRVATVGSRIPYSPSISRTRIFALPWATLRAHSPIARLSTTFPR